MQRSVLILSTISLTAAAAAVVLIASPQSVRAIFPVAEAPQKEEQAAAPRRIKAKKPPKRHQPDAGDIDYDYIREFRRCNAGDQLACKKIAGRGMKDNEETPAAKPQNPAQLLATDNTPAPVFAPTVFNELMVKTSVAYAGKVARCRDQVCRNTLGRDLEKRRIYTKTLSDARVACSRRQIEGCSVQAEIHVAGGELTQAREALRRGVELATSAVSRCGSGQEKDPGICRDSRDWLSSLQKREKDLRDRMLRQR